MVTYYKVHRINFADELIFLSSDEMIFIFRKRKVSVSERSLFFFFFLFF